MDKEIAKEKHQEYNSDIRFVYPGGESFSEMQKRVISFFKEKIKKHDSIIVVTHAGCIRALYSYFKGEDLKENIQMKIKHGAIMKCVIDEDNVDINLLNHSDFEK